jgi:hypothetical protein
MKISILSLVLLLGIAFGAVVKSYIDEQGIPIDHHVGTYLIRDVNQGLYRVTYDVHMLGGDLITNLDSRNDVVTVDCDLNNIELTISFRMEDQAREFANKMNIKNINKFVTSTRWNCNSTDPTSLMIMRKVLSATSTRNVVTLQTTQGFYEESIKDGVVTLQEEEEDGYRKDFCLGANTDNCEVASKPLPIYNNKYMDISCKNCFVGTKATLVLELSIGWFKVKKLIAGLQKININAALILGLDAHYEWSSGYIKEFNLLKEKYIVNFYIGPIPIVISYEIPVTIQAEAAINTQLSIEAGATANWNIGDAYVSWTPEEHWKLVRSNPTYSWNPVLSVSGGFKATAGLSITPAFILHFLRIIDMYVNATPRLDLVAEGDIEKKEACVDVTAEAKAEAGARVHINIPIVNIKYEKSFGPVTLFKTGPKRLIHKCINFKA